MYYLCLRFGVFFSFGVGLDYSFEFGLGFWLGLMIIVWVCLFIEFWFSRLVCCLICLGFWGVDLLVGLFLMGVRCGFCCSRLRCGFACLDCGFGLPFACFAWTLGMICICWLAISLVFGTGDYYFGFINWLLCSLGYFVGCVYVDCLLARFEFRVLTCGWGLVLGGFLSFSASRFGWVACWLFLPLVFWFGVCLLVVLCFAFA